MHGSESQILAVLNQKLKKLSDSVQNVRMSLRDATLRSLLGACACVVCNNIAQLDSIAHSGSAATYVPT